MRRNKNMKMYCTCFMQKKKKEKKEANLLLLHTDKTIKSPNIADKL